MFALTKNSLAAIGKIFKGDAKTVSTYLTELDTEGLKQLANKAKESGAAVVSINGKDFTVN